MKVLREQPSAGFTLIELLVVIAVIGILASLLLPALAAAKRKAQGIQCLNNIKELQLAWHVYADDHNGRLAANTSNAQAGEDIDHPSWVAGKLVAGSSPDNTNVNLLVGTEYQAYGSIGGYIKNRAIYHCPSDTSIDTKFGLPRVRSVSMNGWINPGQNGTVSGDYWDMPFEKYRQITDFIRLSPSDAFVFLDERADSINDGWFKVDTAGYNPMNPAEWSITDLPAIYHNHASTFSFADGHAEAYRWKNGKTLALKYAGKAQNVPNDEDLLWVMEHATQPQ